MTEEVKKKSKRKVRPPKIYRKDGSIRVKKCTKCGNTKLVTLFPPHSTSLDGIAAYCLECKNGLAKNRRINDPKARMKHYIVTRIKNELGDATPKDIQTRLEDYLGYKLIELVRHLRADLKSREKKTLRKCFIEGYHLDHIKPYSSYGIKDCNSPEFKACWHFSNLSMIPGKENLQKGAKYDSTS